MSESKVDSKLMSSVMTAILKHTEKGRQIAEMFETLVPRREYPDYYKIIKSPIALDTIQNRIQSGYYGSYAEIEADFALLVKNAQTYNEPKSEICRDALTIKSLFDTLLAKELKAQEAALAKAEQTAKAKSQKSDKAEKTDDSKSPVASAPTVGGEYSIKKDGIEYTNGDFVYIANPVEPLKPTIGQIVNIFPTPPLSQKRGTTAPTPSMSFSANWYLRPEQTVHKATTRFMENEVLKSNRNETYTADDIVGRCWVLYVKDYIKGRPKDCKDMKHVYVCESRYNDQAKSSSKIKNWTAKEEALELYPSPIVPVKVASIFAEEKDLQPKPAKTPKGSQKEDLMDIDTPATKGRHHDADHKKPAKPDTHHGSSHKEKNRASNLAEDPPIAHQDKKIKLTVKPIAGENDYDYSLKSRHETAVLEPAAPAEVTKDSHFDTAPDGNLKWYPNAPVDVVGKNSLMHSLDYLYRQALAKLRGAEELKPKEADSNPNGPSGAAEQEDLHVRPLTRDHVLKKRKFEERELDDTVGKGFWALARAWLGQAILVKAPLR
ncbi:hypothetical protein HDU97_003884 [Phlyctochytrium planicorne]|nr:hypothetical protein HDU97_003884 [Phlyctochytrium planicorne]